MLFNWLARQGRHQENKKKSSAHRDGQTRPVFNYSWIITGKLAIGPMPRSIEDWELLEKSGIKKRFSCCYAEEHIFAPLPEGWKSSGVCLPDHRAQEHLTVDNLVFALKKAINFIDKDNNPVYLHCFAGQERSALLATGIVSLTENKDLFESLAWVRQCYPQARPLYEHLDILERALLIFN